MNIRVDNLSSPEVISLLQSHLAGMQAQTPTESVHALDLEEYQSTDLTLWTAWDDDVLMGCGALKDLGEQHGEIKSMRTKKEFLRKGVGDAVLTAIIDQAIGLGMRRLSLETGRTEHFAAAQAFYQRRGFIETVPFADYTDDPHSIYFTMEI